MSQRDDFVMLIDFARSADECRSLFDLIDRGLLPELVDKVPGRRGPGWHKDDLRRHFFLLGGQLDHAGNLVLPPMLQQGAPQ
jgi:hypothetical protein